MSKRCMMLIGAIIVGSIMTASQSLQINGEGDEYLASVVLEVPSRDDMVRQAGYGEEKLSTVLITGMLLCNSCVNKQLIPSQPISGAWVAVTCKTKNTHKKRQIRGAKAVSDSHGWFTIDLPSELHAIRNLEHVCSLKVFHLPKSSHCHHQSRKHNKISLLSVENGVRTYAAGAITFHSTIPKNSKGCSRKMYDHHQEKSS